MKIAATQFSLQTNSFEIYLSGCFGSCKGCQNPELKEFDIGEDYLLQIKNILAKIKEFDYLIDDIWILGGEPIDQNLDELEDLFKQLKKSNKNIWLFTRYDLENVPLNIRQYCNYIKTGVYDETKRTEDNIQYEVKLATSNQKIWKKNGDNIFV